MAYDIVFTQRFEEDLGNAVGYLKLFHQSQLVTGDKLEDG